MQRSQLDLQADMPANIRPHRRYNPLTDRWVLVSPQRNKRPWQGQQESTAAEQPSYDPNCYLCPGNERAAGSRNPNYQGVYVFDNDYPALLAQQDESAANATPDASLLQSRETHGCCRVICYSPDHSKTMGSLNDGELFAVVDTWSQQVAELSAHFEHVQVFENRGETMGCSNPHPHGQVWALDQVPSEVELECKQQAAYLAKYGEKLLLHYVRQELDAGERIVVENDDWLALVPWWASWPFETLLLPRFSVEHLPELEQTQRRSLCDALRRLIRCYDALFATTFPYSMGWHGKPSSVTGSHWQLHAHFYPPLLRSATVRKHMVGFEMLGEAQRDLSPEDAAARLRDAQ
ncbi:MAG: UDP-glucose--hexose-1-phosphate uridylyltransferase [Pseudomonadota bacterium]